MKKNIVTTVVYVALITIIIPFIIVFFRAEKNTVAVYISEQDKVEEMEVSQYLKEVVCAEMPAEFSEEALKAQAVAARTYMYSKTAEGGTQEHKGAVVCTDYKHCKAWMKEEDRRKSWGADKQEEYWQKISAAVDDTDGEIITCDGKPIDAVFHSTSSGRTENSEDVWGTALPYLRSVESRGDELSPKFYSEFRCSVDEFKQVISNNNYKTDWNTMLYSDIQRTEGGGIKTINIGGAVVKGTDLRQMFNLRSANIELEQTEGEIIFKVKGNGHGVGMSQYGANFMANNGSTYKEILEYYYSGVVLTKQ